MRTVFGFILLTLVFSHNAIAQTSSQEARSRSCEIKPGCAILVRPTGSDCANYLSWNGTCSGGFIQGKGVMMMRDRNGKPLTAAIENAQAGRPIGIQALDHGVSRWKADDSREFTMCVGAGAVNNAPKANEICLEAFHVRESLGVPQPGELSDTNVGARAFPPGYRASQLSGPAGFTGSFGGVTGGGATAEASGSPYGGQRNVESQALPTSKSCGDVFSAATGVLQSEISKLPNEGYTPRVLEHMVAVQLWRQSTLRAFGPCSSDAQTMSNQDDIVKRAIQSCRSGGGSSCDSGRHLVSSSSQLSTALSSALGNSSSSGGAGCRAAYRELQGQFKSAQGQGTSIQSLQILMWMSSESARLASGACRGQPEETELYSFGPQYDSALKACRGIAANEAVCVPKSPAVALAQSAPSRPAATPQSNSQQSAPVNKSPGLANPDRRESCGPHGCTVR